MMIFVFSLFSLDCLTRADILSLSTNGAYSQYSKLLTKLCLVKALSESLTLPTPRLSGKQIAFGLYYQAVIFFGLNPIREVCYY